MWPHYVRHLFWTKPLKHFDLILLTCTVLLFYVRVEPLYALRVGWQYQYVLGCRYNAGLVTSSTSCFEIPNTHTCIRLTLWPFDQCEEVRQQDSKTVLVHVATEGSECNDTYQCLGIIDTYFTLLAHESWRCNGRTTFWTWMKNLPMRSMSSYYYVKE